MSPTEWGIMTGWIFSIVHVGFTEICDRMLVFVELHSGVLSEYMKDVCEEGDEPKPELLPTSLLLGPQQSKGKRKMLPNLLLLYLFTHTHINIIGLL